MQFIDQPPGSSSAPARRRVPMMVRLWAIAILTACVVVACDRVPLTSPTGSTISVNVDQTTLPIGGQATVRAVVIESSGTPVQNGTTVNFTTTLGTFVPPSVETQNGVATTTFLAGSVSGTTTINAYSGGAGSASGNSSPGGVEVKIGAAGASAIALQVVPPTVPQNGGSVTATALVLDSAGNAMRGVPVLFSTDAGTLSNANVVTDNNGYGVTNLVTTRQATITARAGTATPVTFTVSVSPATTVTISVTGPTSPVVGQPVSFKVELPTATNATPVANVVVDFGDGQSQTLGAITGTVGLTHTYLRQGGYTVTATSTDILGGRGISSVSVLIGFENLPTITISGTPNPVQAGGTQQGIVTFTVTAAAATNGPPIRSVRVTLGDGTVIFNGTGGGSFAYKFGGGGTYTVTATATDAAGSVATTSTVIVVTP